MLIRFQSPHSPIAKCIHSWSINHTGGYLGVCFWNKPRNDVVVSKWNMTVKSNVVLNRKKKHNKKTKQRQSKTKTVTHFAVCCVLLWFGIGKYYQCYRDYGQLINIDIDDSLATKRRHTFTWTNVTKIYDTIRPLSHNKWFKCNYQNLIFLIKLLLKSSMKRKNPHLIWFSKNVVLKTTIIANECFCIIIQISLAITRIFTKECCYLSFISWQK